jgi:hypothetical protein
MVRQPVGEFHNLVIAPSTYSLWVTSDRYNQMIDQYRYQKRTADLISWSLPGGKDDFIRTR